MNQNPISARNYASQAENGLLQFERENSGHYLTSLCPLLVAKIRKAQHFAIPDGGAIFDDRFKGVDPENVKLPYPCITIASSMAGTYGGDFDPLMHTSDISKILVIAEECVISNSIWPAGREGVNIYSANYGNGRWVPNWSVCFKPRQSAHAELCLVGPANDAVRAAVLGQLSAQHGTTLGFQKFQAAAENDSSIDVRFVLELVEALSCRNVTSEPFENIASSTRKIKSKKGKAALYETRRLVLVQPNEAKGPTTSTGTGRSPRAHLRRGHIRRLPTGNIWVNACAVGDIANGFLHKDYAVKGSEQ